MDKNQPSDKQPSLTKARRRARLLSTLAQATAFAGTVLVIGGGEFGRSLYYAGLLLGVFGAVLSRFSGRIIERERESAIEEKEAQIVRFETTPPAKEDLLQTLRRHIKIAVSREEVSMLRAEARANNLFGIGRAFLIASILGPVAAALLYWWVDPVTPETVAQLKDLHQALGPDAFKGVTLSANRDWRILLAGVSFGLLFLAAARGLLNQQAKEAATYFKLEEKINVLERLDSVLSIRAAHPGLEANPSEKALAELVFSGLLDREVTADEKNDSGKGAESAGSSSLSDELFEIAKSIKDAK